MKFIKSKSRSSGESAQELSAALDVHLAELEQFKQDQPGKFLLTSRGLLLGSGFICGYLAGSSNVDTRSLIRFGMASL